jgi:hypothetical protein
MADTSFSVTIPNLPKLQAALSQYPSIATPIVQSAISAAGAILGKYTTGATVPVKTGNLVHNWTLQIAQLVARWFPNANYASFVEFGTAPHVIQAKSAKVLANTQTGEIFGKIVHHPGTKANPFIERIIQSAQPEINTLFGQAGDKITTAIAAQAA